MNASVVLASREQVLVDTSVWVDHLRTPDPELAHLLGAGAVLAHPMVVGELALGRMSNRAAALADLDLLPEPVSASQDEVRVLIEQHALHGTGIGLVDAHLIASTLLTLGCTLWTRDKRLRQAAIRLGIAA